MAVNFDSDTISRQAAIAEVEKSRAYVGHRYNIESMVGRDIFEMLDNVVLGISKLPPAHGTNLAEVGTDCISRQAVKNAICDYVCAPDVRCVSNHECRMKQLISELPPIQQKKGRWIKLDMHRGMADHKCSVCEQECYVPTCMGEPMYAYCPNCGADMREVTE